MIISMTGFGSAIVSLPLKDPQTGTEHEVQLSMTLKTLNSRFFEVNCRIPTSLGFLETEMIRYFKKELHRGTVQFTIYMSSPSALTGAIEPALSTVRGYVSALQKMQAECNLPGTVSISDLVVLDNIFEKKDTPLSEETIERLRTEIHALTEKCVLTRIEEGKSLEKDLKERVALLQKYMRELEPRALQVTADKKAQLLENLKNVLQEVAPDITPESQISATYNQLEKLDIHEEIVRFKTHLNTLETIIASKDIIKGKKIDFTLQELFRETNTIASKCADAQISSLAISIKVELEKAREQAQNIV